MISSVFATAHKALACALASDQGAIDRLAVEARELLEAGRLPAGAVLPALIEAVGSRAAGDYARVIALLEPIADEIVRVGGSHAQFDVFNETLLDAYVRGGQSEKAALILRDRLSRRPAARDEALLASLEPAAPRIP